MSAPADHLRMAEAILFAASGPVTVRALRSYMPDADVEAVLQELRSNYEGRGFGVAETGGGWTFRTRPECSRLAAARKDAPISPQAMETLATIALWGPLTFSEIERIREKDARAVVMTLADRRLIRAGPRREGRVSAMTWVVDTRFLETFDLPAASAMPTWEAARVPDLVDLAVREDEPPEEEAPQQTPAADEEPSDTQVA